MKKQMMVITFLFISTFIFAQQSKVNVSVRDCPDFSMVDTDNNVLENVKDKAFVINFIGYKNIQSSKTLNKFAKLSKQYKDIVFIAVTGDRNDNINSIQETLVTKGDYHLVIMNHEEFKKNILLFNKFPAIPLNFIINNKGEIIYSNYGYFSDDVFSQYVDYLNQAM
ncbi:MAG: TlpA family protein disulfide reductase [Bacteroidales bacterium]